MPRGAADIRTVVVGVGYVGGRLLARLPRESALGLSRSGANAGDHIRKLDLDEPDSHEAELPADCRIVYTVPPSRSAENDIRLEHFLGMLKTPPRRIVYLSTSGVYGDRGGAVVDETVDTKPESPRARRRVSAERTLGDYCKRENIKLVILRVPGIYGPGRLGAERVKDAQPVLDEKYASPGNRIHVDDLVSCAIAALGNDVPAGIYNVGDGDARSSSWFSEEVARQLGLAPPPTIDRQSAEQTFSPMRLSFLRESRRLDLTKMHDVLGVTPHYPDAAAGIAASLKEEEKSR